jgi:hypothetical protein
MHILTGFILAGLAGKLKKDPSLGGLPRFKTGPLRVAHTIPGRIRFVVPSLRDMDKKSLKQFEKLGSLDGVDRMRFSTVTGSVVIRYNPERVDPPILFDAVAHLLGLKEELDRPPSPLLTGELRAIGRSVNRAVYEETYGFIDLWSIAIILLILFGTRKLIQGGWTAFPTGFTLMWWALHSIQK